MKRIFSIAIICMSLLISCKNNKSKSPAEDKKPDSITIVNDEKKKINEAREKTAEELGKLNPLTEEEIKALMPATIADAPLTNYSFNSTLGTALASGEYKLNDSSILILNIYDCAGAGGAGLYNLQFANQLDYTNDNDNEYTKIIDWNGDKAIEHCMKTGKECSLTYFTGKRFLVALEGNVPANELKQIAKGLKIR